MPGPRPQYQDRNRPSDGKGEDRYSDKVKGATDAMEKQPQAPGSTDSTNPVSIISNYSRLGESLKAAGNFRKVAMEIARIAELAETTVTEETADWFDGQTVKRNMTELKKYSGAFSKLAEELDMMQQRASALYDDMGNVLTRYFEMAELQPISSGINPGSGEDKGEEGFSPEDQAPEFDGAGGNPSDDAGRRKHDAQDGDLDDGSVVPDAAADMYDSDDDEDDVLEGIVNRIMEKLVPEGTSEKDARQSLKTPASFARPHTGFTHDQAKEIIKRTGTTTVEGAGKVMEAASSKQKEAAIRKIVDTKSMGKVDGQRVDLFSASHIVAVLDALSGPNKAKYIQMPVAQMADIAFKILKKK